MIMKYKYLGLMQLVERSSFVEFFIAVIHWVNQQRIRPTMATKLGRVCEIPRFSVIILIILLATPILPAAQTNLPIPSSSEILALLHQGHPRLLASAQDFARLKEQLATNAL